MVEQKLQTGPTSLTKDQHVHTTYNHIPLIASLIANLFMEEFKVRDLSSAPLPLSMAKVHG